MIYICAKIKQKEPDKLRRMLSTDELVFPPFDPLAISSIPYSSNTILDDDDWFYIDSVRESKFTIEIIKESYSTVDFRQLTQAEFALIDYLFMMDDDKRFIRFQNISKARLIAKKKITFIGDGFAYNPNCAEIVINEQPDAVYDKNEDRLYFRKIASITSIFNGIDSLYREATQEDVDRFFSNEFIRPKGEYSADKVKTANRKRIALAIDTLSNLGDDDRNSIFSYIGDYCPELKTSDNSFEIGSEEELKMLLFGIEQRFYTTPIGDEKRLANSIISLSKKGAE